MGRFCGKYKKKPMAEAFDKRITKSVYHDGTRAKQ